MTDQQPSPRLVAAGLLLTMLLLVVALRADVDVDRAALDRFGLPDTGQLLKRHGYLASYDGRLRSSRWTLERLTAASVAGDADRANLHFVIDVDVPAEFRARPSTYERSGYDIGHLASAQNHATSAAALADTFRISNAGPQLPGFNRGRWNELERRVRSLAQENRAVWVLTGPLWIADGQQLTVRYLAPDEIPVATHWFKSCIIEGRDGRLRAVTWIVPHVDDPPPLEELLASIDELEHQAGFDAWPMLPGEKQLEAAK